MNETTSYQFQLLNVASSEAKKSVQYPIPDRIIMDRFPRILKRTKNILIDQTSLGSLKVSLLWQDSCKVIFHPKDT